MKRIAYITPLALLCLAVALPVHASVVNGCTNSPENPTAVLGLVVSAACIGFPQLRNRIAKRRKLSQK